MYNGTGNNGFSWTGLYLGTHAGYGWSAANQDLTNFLGMLGLGGFDMKGGFGGGQLGYNYQTGMFVLGVEADGSYGPISQSVTALGVTGKSEIDYFGTVRARAGVDIDHVLIYGTGGFAFAHNTLSITAPGFYAAVDRTHTGWVAGGGIEWAFARSWTLKAEYLYADYGSQTYTYSGLSAATGNVQFSTVKVGFNYLFH